MSASKFIYRNTAGNFAEGDISLHDYEFAAKHNLKVAQVVNAKHPDADKRFGTAWSQGMEAVGIYPKGVPEMGIPATTMRDALNGDCMNQGGILQLAGNSISAPSIPVGSSTPTSRLFLPEVILQTMEATLTEDYDPEVAMFNSMIAISDSITGPIWTQPIIDVTAPRDIDARAIAQNALPRNMVSITASQVSRSISPTSVGLQVSEQAQQLSTIDMVSIILRQQFEGARYRQLWADVSNIINGNIDAGEVALTPVGFKATYDGSAAVDTITHKGWMKCLYDPERKIRIDSIICTMDDYLAIQNRVGRPLMFDPATSGVNVGNAGTYGLDVTMSMPGNMAAIAVPKVMLIPTGILGAQQILMFDSRYALRRVTSTSASYAASQDMVLQRSTHWRWDVAEMTHRFMYDSIRLLDYNNP